MNNDEIAEFLKSNSIVYDVIDYRSSKFYRKYIFKLSYSTSACDAWFYGMQDHTKNKYTKLVSGIPKYRLQKLTQQQKDHLQKELEFIQKFKDLKVKKQISTREEGYTASLFFNDISLLKEFVDSGILKFTTFSHIQNVVAGKIHRKRKTIFKYRVFVSRVLSDADLLALQQLRTNFTEPIKINVTRHYKLNSGNHYCGQSPYIDLGSGEMISYLSLLLPNKISKVFEFVNPPTSDDDAINT